MSDLLGEMRLRGIMLPQKLVGNNAENQTHIIALLCYCMRRCVSIDAPRIVDR